MMGVAANQKQLANVAKAVTLVPILVAVSVIGDVCSEDTIIAVRHQVRTLAGMAGATDVAERGWAATADIARQVGTVWAAADIG